MLCHPGKVVTLSSTIFFNSSSAHCAHPVKTDLNKKLDTKEKTIQSFNIDAQGFRKTGKENPSTWEIGVTS